MVESDIKGGAEVFSVQALRPWSPDPQFPADQTTLVGVGTHKSEVIAMVEEPSD